MDEICSLYSQFNTQNNEIILNVSKDLLNIYQNPSNIYLIFEIIKNVNDQTIKVLALTGLKKMMILHWISCYHQNENGMNIQNQFLLLLQTFQDNSYISSLIVDCMSPIFQTVGFNWPELMNFIVNNVTPASVCVISTILSFLTSENLCSNNEFITFCCNTINQCLVKSNENIELTIQSADIFMYLAKSLPLELSSSLNVFLEEYISIFDRNHDYRLAKSISHSFNPKNPFFNAENLLMHFLEMCMKSDPRAYSILIRKLISAFGKNLRQCFQVVIETIKNIISSLFSDECFSVDSDANFIADIVRKCCNKCESSNFVNLLAPLLTVNSPQECFAVLEILYSTISDIGTALPSIYNQLLSIVLNSFSIDNHLIQELALVTLIDLIDTELFDDYAENVFKTIMTKMNSRHQPIVELTTKVLTNILFNATIPIDILTSVFPSFLTAAEQQQNAHTNQQYTGYGSFKANLILLTCGFIFALGDNIDSFANRVIPIIINGTQDPDIEVQCRSLESLGAIIMYSPAKCNEIIEQSMNLFLSALDNKETAFSALSGLEYSAKAPIGIDPFIEIAIMKSIHFAAPEIMSSAEENDDIEYTGETLELMEKAIKFMNVILKIRPQACNRWRQLIATCCFIHMKNDGDEDIFGPAVMALLRSLNDDATNPTICEALLNNIKMEMKKAAAATFKGISHVLKVTQRVDFDFLKQLFQYAIDALQRQLPCQQANIEKDDDQILGKYDKKIIKDVIKFLSLFAEKLPDHFPINNYFNLIISLQGKVSQYETEMCLMPISSYLKSCPSFQPTQQFLLFALSLSDKPQTQMPFTLIRIIIQNHINLNTLNNIDQLQQIIQICENHLKGPNTNISILSLMFIFSEIPQFPIQNYMEILIKKLPVKGNIEDLDIIWSHLCSLLLSNLSNYSSVLHVVFQKCLETLNLYQDSFSAGTVKIMVTYIRNVIVGNQELIQRTSQFTYVSRLLQNSIDT